jgi:hypothetical protein
MQEHTAIQHSKDMKARKENNLQVSNWQNNNFSDYKNIF